MMKKTMLILLIAFNSYSCVRKMGIPKSDLKYFDNTFNAIIENNIFKVNGKRYGSPSFLRLFEIQSNSLKPVNLKFNEINKLQITYIDNDSIITKEFYGEFKEHGFYEIFLRNQNKGTTIFYGNHNVNRIRIGLTASGKLVVDNEWNESGNVLFLGVGDKGRRQCFFNLKSF